MTSIQSPGVDCHLGEQLVPGDPLAIHGMNFSGRTKLLRQAAGLEATPAARIGKEPGRGSGGGLRIYVGPEIYNSISGLAPTVLEEIQLHSPGAAPDRAILRLLSDLDLPRLYDHNPFTVSGGEQALVVIAAALALTPSVLALDCCLEQVDAELRDRVLRHLNHGAASRTAVMIADNRFAEYGPPPLRRITLDLSGDSDLVGEDARLSTLSPLREGALIPSAAAALQLDEVSYSYPGGPPVLRGVSMSLEPGAIYVLDGRNGAGKSTLAKILCGVLKPHRGTLYRGGEILEAWSRPGRFVGYHFQNPDVQLFARSVSAEISSGPRASGLPPGSVEERTAALLEAFGLTCVQDWHPLDLPFAARKRVALAATLAMGTPWILLDEPTLGQDSDAIRVLVEMIHEYARAGGGAVIISHSSEFREHLRGRRLLLEGGMICE
jgi:energy-coupling factor transporter ATP-binding protein EcfA2